MCLTENDYRANISYSFLQQDLFPVTQKLEEWRQIYPFRCYKNSLQNYTLSNHTMCRLTSKPKTNTINPLVDFYMEKQGRKLE